MTEKNFSLGSDIQSELYGYSSLMTKLTNLYNTNTLPNAILLTSPSGCGKATFFFHLVNYILSKDENLPYTLKDQSINTNNKSFNLVRNKSHPNFVHIKATKKFIEIDKIRNVISFLNKTSFNNKEKIVFIEDVNKLNKNAANSLLKTLEEPTEGTFFFLSYNSSGYLSDTIKSRCKEFKINFSKKERENIILNLSKYFKLDPVDGLSKEYFVHESPGNIIKFIIIKSTYNIEINDKKKFLEYLIDLHFSTKDEFIYEILKISIENFFHSKYLSNYNNLSFYRDRKNILEKINLMEKFNLDQKNIFFEIKNIINNA